MTDDLQDKLALLLKSERTLMRLELRKKVRQAVLLILACIAIFSAFIALNVTLYLYLSTLIEPIYSALSIASIDILIALLLLLIAANLGLGEDEKSAYEIRDFARNQVQKEVHSLRSNLLSFKHLIQLISVFKKGKS